MIRKILVIVLKIILFLIILIFAISIFFQVKVELYRKEIKSLYDFKYLSKERRKYTPFVYFFYESKKFKENKCYWRNIKKPYEEFERDNNIERNLGDTFTWEFNVEFNAYLMYCYYDLSELDCK